MRKIGIILGLTLMIGLSSCSISQALNLKDCQYTYSHISDITVMGMSRQELSSISGMAQLTKALLGKTDQFRMGCTVHLRVYNPNKQTASVDKIFYAVALDSIRLADGSSQQPFVVAGESYEDMPLCLNVDMKKLFEKHSRATVTNVVKNFLNLSDTPVRVTIMLKPLIRVGNSSISVPKPIPVVFEYGGKKE